MRFLDGQVVFAGAAILGLLACSASYSEASGGIGEGDFADAGGATGFAGPTCTEDAGVLTPIGPQGCGPNQTVVYRKPLAGGSGASAVTSAAGTANTAQPAMVTACTDTKCAPGQVAVVTYQATAPSDPLADGGPSDDAATSLGEGAAPVADGDAAVAPVADGGAVPPSGDAALLPDGDAPDASAVATADASGGSTASSGDGGVIGIPCGAVVTCIDSPPACPQGQSPSFAPSGKWHCMPNCDPNSSVIISYGSTYGNTTICAPPPPMTACTQGQVWTWDFANEEWVCAPECNNGQYDQHTYAGQTVCVPC
ncbi:MAG TPA: hypothetical protein VMI75_38885 [Polyangiaceae bacterium]|nr:hypothetical protein [Polyangiaceae bacterium]